MDKKENLSVCFWNIHGQKSKLTGDKFLDIEFTQLCHKHDILGFVELHTETIPCISGFKLIKQKIRKKNHCGPKISGGLAIFVKTEISHMVKYISNTHEDSIWIKLCKGQAKQREDIYIGTIYISPAKNKNSHLSLEKFLEEAKSFSEKGVVFIQGDFNARTGTEPDFIEYDKSDDSFYILNLEKPLVRNSEDRKLCERGTKLLDLCKSMDFLIVNGRKTGDIFGKYTSIHWNGSSIVDYVITPALSFDRVMKFQVGKFYPWFSDHCP